jgi:transcription-repair coupling factor (superfamily II helicase)
MASLRCAAALIDLFPSGEPDALRLDFFGDEIESLRRFDPADQRSKGKADAFTLMPASEALLDEDNIKRFRERYRETFGATATGDPLYQAVSDGRRLAGHGALAALVRGAARHLFDSSRGRTIVVRDAGTDGALESRSRASRIISRTAPGRCSRSRAAIARCRRGRSISSGRNGTRRCGRPDPPTSPLPEPESARSVDFGVEPARDFAPERAKAMPMSTKRSQAYRASFGKAGARSSSQAIPGALASGLRAARGSWLKSQKLVDSWQEALGAKQPTGADGPSARPRLHHAGRRGAHRAGHARRPAGPPAQAPKSADAFLAELATLAPGDLSSTAITASAATMG